MENNTNLIMYTTEDGITKIQATFDKDTVWLSIDQMAELFQRNKSTISRHIKNIFEEGEYVSDSVVANFATTAAEIIYERADSEKQNMGLTGWSGKEIKKTDVEIAKNYLSESELDALNKIVTAYLDIAEVRALDHEPMYMKDWLETIDDYLKMTRREILSTAGRISHTQALDKAHDEYKKYKQKEKDRLSLVEKHFLQSIGELDKIEEKSK